MTFNRHAAVEGISRDLALYVLVCSGNERKNTHTQNSRTQLWKWVRERRAPGCVMRTRPRHHLTSPPPPPTLLPPEDMTHAHTLIKRHLFGCLMSTALLPFTPVTLHFPSPLGLTRRSARKQTHSWPCGFSASPDPACWQSGVCALLAKGGGGALNGAGHVNPTWKTPDLSSQIDGII